MVTSMMCDDLMRDDFRRSQSSMVGWLLAASWLYYHKPDLSPILEDTTFDRACKWLHGNFDNITHPLKHLITKEDLASGSFYSVQCHQYPTFISSFAEEMSKVDCTPTWLSKIKSNKNPSV